MVNYLLITPARRPSSNAGLPRGEEFGGGKGAGRVAVPALSANRDFQRFPQQAEDDRVFADVVADAESMISDFIARPLTDAALPAVDVSVWPIWPATMSPNLSAVPLGASSLKR